jgi:hypothetical protein
VYPADHDRRSTSYGDIVSEEDPNLLQSSSMGLGKDTVKSDYTGERWENEHCMISATKYLSGHCKLVPTKEKSPPNFCKPRGSNAGVQHSHKEETADRKGDPLGSHPSGEELCSVHIAG